MYNTWLYIAKKYYRTCFNELIKLTKSVILSPNIETTAYEYLRLVSSAIYPIIGGPSKKPKKLTLETIVNAILGEPFVLRPAILYMVGTILDMPNPTIIKPIAEGIR